MSRLTSTEVIESGKYLDDDFDPTTLTIPHLTAILNYHDIPRPTQANKAKLVQTFRDEIYPRREHFLEERRASESSQPSAIGIHDGHTGAHLGSPETRKPLRRSSRVGSRAPSVEQESGPVPPKPKRRRSSSNPPETLSHRSTKLDSRPSQGTLYEESEPEEDGEPARKMNRRKGPAKSNSSSSRRVSTKIGTGAEDSPWEDTNIFQSGNESSSPVRHSKPRSSTAFRSPKRSSMSAPPDSPGSSPARRSAPSIPTFSPRLPDFATRFREAQGSPLRKSEIGNDSLMVQKELLEEEGEEDADVESGGEDEYPSSPATKELEAYNDAVSAGMARLADGNAETSVTGQMTRRRRSRFWMLLLIGGFFAVLFPYMKESRLIGYCERNSSSNSVLREKAEAVQEKERCTNLFIEMQRQNQSFLDSELKCQPLPVVSWPAPNECAPCPAHGNCTLHDVICDESFALRTHPVGFLGYFLDGLPFLGPVAFPPSCVEDKAGLRKATAFSQRLSNYLAKLRGQRLCAQTIHAADDPVSQAKAYGEEVNQVREALRQVFVGEYRQKHGSHTSPPDLAQFDKNFDNGIKRLVDIKALIYGQDTNGAIYIAAPQGDLTTVCYIKVISRAAWEEWKKTLFVWIGVIIIGFLLRHRSRRNRLEAARVSGLVQTALDQLRQQEMAHYTDPVSVRQPYLSSLHLRDLILRDVHSVGARKRLWDRVERVVENNANVRVNTEEVQGDEVKVWRWIGSAGAETGVKHEAS